MKIKCTFIYETKEHDTFADAKTADPTRVKSRKQTERNFVDRMTQILHIYMDDDVDSVSEIKAKIIERKDN